MGLLSKLGALFGGGKSTKRYENLFKQATGMGQSVPYALKQAIDMAIRDGAFPDEKSAVKGLREGLMATVDPDLKSDLEKALAKYDK